MGTWLSMGVWFTYQGPCCQSKKTFLLSEDTVNCSSVRTGNLSSSLFYYWEKTTLHWIKGLLTVSEVYYIIIMIGSMAVSIANMMFEQ